MPDHFKTFETTLAQYGAPIIAVSAMSIVIDRHNAAGGLHPAVDQFVHEVFETSQILTALLIHDD